eukprot:393167-Pelagomonas_calceolata.AAC.1
MFHQQPISLKFGPWVTNVNPATAAAPVQEMHAGGFGGAQRHGQTADQETRVWFTRFTREHNLQPDSLAAQ